MGALAEHIINLIVPQDYVPRGIVPEGTNFVVRERDLEAEAREAQRIPVAIRRLPGIIGGSMIVYHDESAPRVRNGMF